MSTFPPALAMRSRTGPPVGSDGEHVSRLRAEVEEYGWGRPEPREVPRSRLEAGWHADYARTGDPRALRSCRCEGCRRAGRGGLVYRNGEHNEQEHDNGEASGEQVEGTNHEVRATGGRPPVASR